MIRLWWWPKSPSGSRDLFLKVFHHWAIRQKDRKSTQSVNLSTPYAHLSRSIFFCKGIFQISTRQWYLCGHFKVKVIWCQKECVLVPPDEWHPGINYTLRSVKPLFQFLLEILYVQKWFDISMTLIFDLESPKLNRWYPVPNYTSVPLYVIEEKWPESGFDLSVTFAFELWSLKSTKMSVTPHL